MTHLGDNLSALVDGELSGTDLDRASAHLASCDKCRGEAAALRALKTELRALVANGTDEDALTIRLLSMPGHSDASRSDTGCSDTGRWDRLDRQRPPGRRGGVRRPPRSPRRRYLVWSAVSLAVVGGLGAAAFSIGGGASDPGPVVPQVEMFNMEHAVDSGDVPFPGPSASTTPANDKAARNQAATQKP